MARLRIGELLVSAKVLSSEQLEEALQTPRAPGQRLGELLVSQGLVTETQLTQTLGQQLAVPWVSLYHVDFSRQLLNLVPHELADRYCLVPIFVRRVKRQDTLYVAMADPTNEAALQEVSRSAGLPARPMIGSPTDIRSAIRVYYGTGPDPQERETPRPIPPPPPTNPDGLAAKRAAASVAAPAAAPLKPPPAPAPPKRRGSVPKTPVAERASAESVPPGVKPEAQRPSEAPVSIPATVPEPGRAPAATGKAKAEERPSRTSTEVAERPSLERPSAGVAERPSPERPSGEVADRPSIERPVRDRVSTERPSVERASVEIRSADGPDEDPEIEAREIYVNRQWRRPPMVPITFLDGSTIHLPARVQHRRGSTVPPGADVSEGLTARDLITALRARTEGADARAVLGEDLRWEPLFASLLSLLMRKGLLADWEFIDEFRRVTARRAAKGSSEK